MQLQHFHSPDPATGSNDKPLPFLGGQEVSLNFFECDHRFIDELSDSVVTDLTQAFIPYYNSPENVPKCLKFYDN